MAMKFGNSTFPRDDDVDRRRGYFPPEAIASARTILSMLQEKKFQERDHQALINFPLFADDGGGDDVDTTLSLSIDYSRKSTSPPVLNPMPLRSFPPAAAATNIREEATGINSSTSLSLGPLPLRANKRKREGKDAVKKRGEPSGNVNGEVPPPPVVPSIDEFPLLKQALEEKGVMPVFLYRKKLQGSDVKGGLNRLFLTKREPLMEFLTAEEAAAVDGGDGGITVVGVDECGKPYSLGVRKWPSLKMTVIISDWKRLAAANAAKKGDFVEIWGFRSEGKLGLAVTFRR